MCPTYPETPPKLERYFTYRLNTLSKLNDLASHSLYLTQGGLSLSESRALASIGSFPQITVNQLAFEANLDKGQASRAAQSLVDKGLVIKTHNLVDGRSVILALTTKGKPVWRKLMALMEQRNQALMRCLSPEEQTQLIGMFERMLKQAQADHAGHPAGEMR
jgi:DNA-binding MarR family transcriptional regulator